MSSLNKEAKLGTCHDTLYCGMCSVNYLYVNVFREGVGVCWISRNC